MEDLQTRSEHSRSVDDAEKYKALQTLRELGLLVPLSSAETFHGRLTQMGDEPWRVDPTFSNGGNDSGNSNVNSRPTLYTASEDVAKEFARQRAVLKIWPEYMAYFEDKVRNYTSAEKTDWLSRVHRRQKEWWATVPDQSKNLYPEGLRLKTIEELQNDQLAIRIEAKDLQTRSSDEEKERVWNQIAGVYRQQTHEIGSVDGDANILRFTFDKEELSEEDLQKLKDAISRLVIRITDGSPVDFMDRDKLEVFIASFNQLGKAVLNIEDVKNLARQADMPEATVAQLVGAYNARTVFMQDPVWLTRRVTKNRKDIFFDKITVNNQEIEVPFNAEYILRLLQNMHVVGFEQLLDSTTLGKIITSNSIFNLSAVDTKEGLAKQKKEASKVFGSLGSQIKKLWPKTVLPEATLIGALDNVYSKPEQLIARAAEVEGYAEVFAADAGNWEGFTIAEHTETVLRNFDENYADILPVELLAPLRLVILVHDLGKPEAVMNGERYNQRHYNLRRADDFFEKLQLEPSLKHFLLGLLAAQSLAFEAQIKKSDRAKEALGLIARQTLGQFYDSPHITAEQIKAFEEMSKIIQLCDGGAYTSMAVTRTKEGNYYRNAPSFNGSFAPPHDPANRRLRLRGVGEKPAPTVLTPRL